MSAIRQSPRSIGPTIPIHTQSPKSFVRTISISRLPFTSIVRAIPINRRYTKSIIPTISTNTISKTTSENAVGGQSLKSTARRFQNISAYGLFCFVKPFFMIYI